MEKGRGAQAEDCLLKLPSEGGTLLSLEGGIRMTAAQAQAAMYARKAVSLSVQSEHPYMQSLYEWSLSIGATLILLRVLMPKQA